MAVARALSRCWRSVAAIACAFAATLLILVPGVPAQAQPSTGQIEAQIAAADNKLEPIIEGYNRVHSLLAVNQSKADALQRKLAPLDLQVKLAQAQLSPVATQIYQTGSNSTLGLLLDGGSAITLLDRLTISNELARQTQLQISSVQALRDTYATAKAALDQTLASLNAQNAELSVKKKTIETQIAALQRLRQRAYGGSGTVGKLQPVACPYTYSSGPGGVAARTACAQIGKPYVWAAAGPNSFDCSGLTLYAWAKAGKTLRHYTKWQWADTTPVTKSQLQPGDLVFFYPPTLHHLGIYVGGGWIVHAPHTGDYVRMTRIDSMPIAGYRRP